MAENINLWDKTSKVASVLAAVFTLYISIKYTGLEKQMKISQDELNLSINQMKKNQDSLDFDRKHRFSIYDKVYSAIESKQPEKIELAAILVTELLAGDGFQRQLLNVLASQKSTPISASAKLSISKTIAQLDTFAKYEQEKEVQVKSFAKEHTEKSAKKDFLVDIFYLESKGETQKQLAQNYEKLLTKNGFDVRVRKLSDVINARKGYQIYTNQIRVELDNETEIKLGNEIKNIMNSMNAEVVQVSQSSVGYISVFIVE